MEATLVALILAALGYYMWRYRRVQRLLSSLTITDHEIQKTLVSGLYHRFRADQDEKKDTSYEFEDFVANVLEQYYGGMATVTQLSADGGTLIKHKRNGAFFYGHALCMTEDVTYDTIAVLHSRLIKDHAAGGFIVTLGDYSPAARKYALEINSNLELIDGQTLVRYWAESVEATRNGLQQTKMDLAFWKKE